MDNQNNILDWDSDVCADNSDEEISNKMQHHSNNLSNEILRVFDSNENSNNFINDSLLDLDINESSEQYHANLVDENHMLVIEKEKIEDDLSFRVESKEELSNADILPPKEERVDVTISDRNNSHEFEDKPEKLNVVDKSGKQTVSSTKCEVCSETVYPMEKLIMDSKIYHKTCFRCCKCKKTLSPTVVSKFNGNLFCKPHYIEMFRMRGRYDDIDVNKPSSGSSSSSYNFISQKFIPSSNNETNSKNNRPEEKKEGSAGAKLLASRYQKSFEGDVDENPQRKSPIDIGIKRRVSDAAKAWNEGQTTDETCSRQFNTNNNSINEVNEINKSAKESVKNLRALFEQNN